MGDTTITAGDDFRAWSGGYRRRMVSARQSPGYELARVRAWRPPTWAAIRAYLRTHTLLADSLFAVAIFAAELGLWAASEPVMKLYPPPEAIAPVALSWPWTAAGAVAVALRRRWAGPAMVLLAAHTAGSMIFNVANNGLAIIVLTYTVATHRSVKMAAVSAVLFWIPGLIIATMFGTYRQSGVSVGVFWIFNGLVALAALLTGRIVFHRRRHVAALVERARVAEQNQRTLAAQAVADERRRIARELHDVVAHHVSVMSVLASASRRTLHTEPDTASETLTTIEETGRTTLRELRRLLDVLRTEPEPPGDLTPQPDLASLGGLIDQVREAGLPVRLTVTGEPLNTATAMEPGAALAVYRIVQEALTNVLKHAGPAASAQVFLRIDPDWLVVEIVDTGRGPNPAGAVGHGLLGMRERVGLYGGSLRTGPRPGGGFRVVARIPIEEVPHG